MSLLNRVNNTTNDNNNNNNQQQNTSPFGRPSSSNNDNNGRPAFGGRPSAPTPAPNNNNQPQPASRFGSRFGAAKLQVSDTLMPTRKTVVHFELNGLGDPFYHLMDHELNPTMGDSKEVTKTLEQGGENIKKLMEILDHGWEKLGFEGAALVYIYNKNIWDQASSTSLRPKNEDNLFDDIEGEEEKKPETPTYEAIRAINLQIVLNVLARARTQLLLAKAPLIFNQQYLNRTLISDDPRLVQIVKATGYMPC